jgi:hypothetical protein
LLLIKVLFSLLFEEKANTTFSVVGDAAIYINGMVFQMKQQENGVVKINRARLT